MSRRLGLALTTLAAGAGLLTAAALGTAAAAAPTPGILKVGGTGNLDSVDPAIASGSTSWMFEYATGAWLYNYRDSGALGLAPEVAKRFTVSKNGRVYHFYLRGGYRFSDGEPVTAQSFAYAIQRAKSKGLGSPGGSFVSDPNAVDITAVKASGLKLTIRLRRPAPALLTTLAMPFFQAASSKLPLNREVVDVNRVGDLPTAGPYTWSYHLPNHQANIVRNPYYRGPRPHHVAGVEFDMRLDVNDCFQRTVSGDLDLGCVPADQLQNVEDTYGISRRKPVKTGRFWIKAGGCLSSILINQRRALFHDNPSLRKAINWAVDRTTFGGGSSTGSAWTHLLAPGVPGSSWRQPYSVRGNLAKARRLAAGHFRNGHIRVAYQSAGSVGPLEAQQLRQVLIALGFDQSRIDMVGFAGFDIYTAAGTRGAPFDLVLGIAYCADNEDPADLLDASIDPGRWHGPENNFAAYAVNSPIYRAKLASISRRLKGAARLRALGRLDLEISRKLAPQVPLFADGDDYFFSGRVSPKSVAFTRDGLSFPALEIR